MRQIRSLALALAFTAAATPAFAQLSPAGGMGGGMGGGGMGGMGGMARGGGPGAAPHNPAPNIAPPALPGAGMPAPLATGPALQKKQAGDPTKALFAAIVKGDNSAAQEALARGANLNAQNQFGETPLDESIALDRTSITFLLLKTRNELAAQGGSSEPIGAPWLLTRGKHEKGKQAKNGHITRAVPASIHATQKRPRVALPAPTGTPDPQAGFLGFGPKKQ